MNEVTIMMLIFRVLIRALGMLLWERRRCTSLESTGKNKRATNDSLAFAHKSDRSDNKNDRLTVVPGHAARYLHQDPCVAEDHDDQGKEEEAHKGEHVVEGLLPVLDKAPVGSALGKVLRDSDGYIVKNKHLGEKRKKRLVSDASKSVAADGILMKLICFDL